MPTSPRTDDIVQVESNVFLVSGSNTNWVIIKDGASCTLVDSGYPGDRDAVLGSLATLGLGPRDVSAVLITHAHNDHIGAAEHLRAAYEVPVLMHPEEVPHARRDFLDQVSVGQVLGQAWRPGVLPWAVHALRAGGTTHVPVCEPQAFPAAGALDLPGAPVPVHTPGHTKGHCAYHLPKSGILITGDALVTAHPTSRISGPQLLPEMFHTDRARALDSLTTLENLDAGLLLPGHGPAHRGPAKEAAATARERASR
ncbi:glyoxylase-like metal-dependent hydrolase (beta-lactamase superfamily II) [Streptomyces sp. TLI_55]|uniref:MBL fold metallo-hydrolase n=1 Tax=Streptomyces sp. TLI_55 TaxID=1938861 RepID=UPI000BD6BB72|nr:MBL fold metallo-hydrolase [Streptomyces sp. TLI_55]SNX88308.1 glyoxylase-like metal-dependent hydrolase (beta-lactamase superfamily II) [Streptomyces sp. TLI_55]